ncbi:MAG TPA: hypothetical protein VNT79_11315, partial [Phycisphaerae bacterium]|nr:hypothetical protein [Phycisphaerae bacterium]
IRMQIHINQGNEVRIEQGDDGQITVTKTERDGDNESTTTQTYDNEEAFEKGDPDSFKMFKSGIGGGDGDFSFFFNQMPKGGMFGGPHGQFKGRLDMKELHEAAEQMRRQAEDAREQAGQSRGQARPRRRGEVRMERKAGASFEVATDGSVRATIRSGDSEVVETFKNVDEMRRERPELYEKYQSVRGEKN